MRASVVVPLVVGGGSNANGWLGVLLGVGLWYGFYGGVMASEGGVQGKMEGLCRE
eukprot:COSAG05_NODE_14313_length_400_cov_16.551495_1_plen_54_part_01